MKINELILNCNYKDYVLDIDMIPKEDITMYIVYVKTKNRNPNLWAEIKISDELLSDFNECIEYICERSIAKFNRIKSEINEN